MRASPLFGFVFQKKKNGYTTKVFELICLEFVIESINSVNKLCIKQIPLPGSSSESVKKQM